MAYRSQKTSRCALVAAFLLIPAALGASPLRFEVRHDRLLKDHAGILLIDERGISYESMGARETRRWEYPDIQQLFVLPQKLVVLTYQDRPWLLGADREYEFKLTGGQSFEEAYEFLKDRLDRRFVAALPDTRAEPLWELPVKLLGTLKGSEGVLVVGADRIVFKTDRKGQSRTWRDQDIENVSTSGAYQFTLTSYERAKMHYGSLKSFNFQLKQPLDERKFDLLWRRLNQSKGLQYFHSFQEKNNQ